MKKIIFVYGSISGVIAIGFIMVSIILGNPESYAGSEWIGYLVMITSLSLVFFGVKTYRDDHLGGVIGFWDALKVGLGITLVASVVYVGVWELYLFTSDYQFMDTYADSYIEQLRTEGATSTELSEAEALMDQYRQMYQNPVARAGITFLEIFPVGLIIGLVSAVLLRKSDFLPPNKDKVMANAGIDAADDTTGG